jgi:hypothetical protein
VNTLKSEEYRRPLNDIDTLLDYLDMALNDNEPMRAWMYTNMLESCLNLIRARLSYDMDPRT